MPDFDKIGLQDLYGGQSAEGDETFSRKSRIDPRNTTTLYRPQPYTDVVGFGATGDGTTDDTDAIQRAINATTRGIIFFRPGTYRITSKLSVPETCLCSFIGSGKDPENNGGSLIETDFATADILFEIRGFRWRRFADLCLSVASGAAAVPTHFIQIKNGASITISHSQFERLRIVGSAKTDGNVAIDIGEDEILQGDNLSFRDVDIQKVERGIQFRNIQTVGLEGSKIHFLDVSYGLVFTDDIAAPTYQGGGVANFSSVQQTASADDGSSDTVIYIRAAGTHSSYTFTNASTEKDSVLLDVSGADAAGNCIITNMIAPRSSRNDRTNPYFKLGAATVTNVLGGWLRTSPGNTEIAMTGGKDTGDCILNIQGAYLEDSTTTPTSPLTISTDDNSFYKIENCMKFVMTTDDIWTNSVFYSRSSGRVVMPNMYKQPTTPVQQMWLPLTTENAAGESKKVTRYLPDNTIITKLRVCITATTATAGYFQIAIPEGVATYVGRIDGTVAHSFECGWGWSSGAVGSKGVDFDLSDSNFSLDGGSITFRRSDDDLLNASGYVYIEYMYTEDYSGVKWDIGQAGL